MLALCIGRGPGPYHFGEVSDAAADADPGREFPCPTCGARLAGFPADTRITFEPGTVGFEGVIAYYAADHPDRGWVWLDSAAQGRILAPINRLVLA